MRGRELVRLMAERLGELRDEVVFLGGAVTDLLITDEAAAEVRYTQDVDVMPTEPTVLGFGNRWYAPAVHAAKDHQLGPVTVRIVTAPFFVATKLEAFRGRGAGDYLTSHDMEDLVAVVDGRPELLEEVRAAPPDLRRYLHEEFTVLLSESLFLEALPGHLEADMASQARLPLLIARFHALAGSR